VRDRIAALKEAARAGFDARPRGKRLRPKRGFRGFEGVRFGHFGICLEIKCEATSAVGYRPREPTT